MNAATDTTKFTDFHGRRPGARRLGAQGNRDRRDRDARPHGDPRGVRARAAAARRAHRRLAAHDDPDRGADRDAAGARRRGALGLVQHLLDAGPRGRRDRRRAARRSSRTRARRSTEYWDYTHRIFEWPASQDAAAAPNMILDDGGDATLLVHLGAQAETDPSLHRRIRRTRRRPRSSTRSARGSRRTRSSIRASRPASRASPRRRRPASSASTRCTRKAGWASRRSTSTTR